jgi:hypothetical protein
MLATGRPFFSLTSTATTNLLPGVVCCQVGLTLGKWADLARPALDVHVIQPAAGRRLNPTSRT